MRTSTGQVGDGTTVDKAVPPRWEPRPTGRRWQPRTAITRVLSAIREPCGAGAATPRARSVMAQRVAKSTPVQVGTATDWKSVAAAGGRTLPASRNTGTVWCWGLNHAGQMGNGTVGGYPVNPRASRHRDQLDDDRRRVPATTAACETPAHCGVGATTTSASWATAHSSTSRPDTDRHGNRLEEHRVPRRVHLPHDGTAGTLWCWGDNDFGQLGNGTTLDKLIPTQVGTATTWNAAATGFGHSLPRSGLTSPCGAGAPTPAVRSETERR